MNIYQHLFFIIPMVTLLSYGISYWYTPFNSSKNFYFVSTAVSFYLGAVLAVWYTVQAVVPYLLDFYTTLGGL